MLYYMIYTILYYGFKLIYSIYIYMLRHVYIYIHININIYIKYIIYPLYIYKSIDIYIYILLYYYMLHSIYYILYFKYHLLDTLYYMLNIIYHILFSVNQDYIYIYTTYFISSYTVYVMCCICYKVKCYILLYHVLNNRNYTQYRDIYNMCFLQYIMYYIYIV